MLSPEANKAICHAYNLPETMECAGASLSVAFTISGASRLEDTVAEAVEYISDEHRDMAEYEGMSEEYVAVRETLSDELTFCDAPPDHVFLRMSEKGEVEGQSILITVSMSAYRQYVGAV